MSKTTDTNAFLVDPIQIERRARRLRAEWLRSLVARRRG